MAGKPILNGRDSVRKVLDTFKDRGGQWAEYATMYYGPVIELFDCEKTIYTAVEVTAGNRCVAGGWRGSRSEIIRVVVIGGLALGIFSHISG